MDFLKLISEGRIEQFETKYSKKFSPEQLKKMPRVLERIESVKNYRLKSEKKQTRDLAEKSGCSEAVKVADQMFPFLSPNVCAKKEEKLV